MEYSEHGITGVFGSRRKAVAEALFHVGSGSAALWRGTGWLDFGPPSLPSYDATMAEAMAELRAGRVVTVAGDAGRAYVEGWYVNTG